MIRSCLLVGQGTGLCCGFGPIKLGSADTQLLETVKGRVRDALANDAHVCVEDEAPLALPVW